VEVVGSLVVEHFQVSPVQLLKLGGIPIILDQDTMVQLLAALASALFVASDLMIGVEVFKGLIDKAIHIILLEVDQLVGVKSHLRQVLIHGSQKLARASVDYLH
jgi:hypothetical protein